ncbi:MAG: diadenylate cyclase [Spirochaetales bacterium]|nr:diadenylate cyclase [Spirochaetales bacterium]MCF7939613.1 diadenylate cyclase [Spirochaetales bacterium]
MALSSYLSPLRVGVYQGKDKQEIISSLVSSICGTAPGLDPEVIKQGILDREKQLSSRLAPGIALPHMVLDELQHSLLAVGLSREGISWDPSTEDKVHLVLLLIGDRNEHLMVLSEIAMHLKQWEFHIRDDWDLDAEELYRLLTEDKKEVGEQVTPKNREISYLSFQQALVAERELGGAPLVVYADALGTLAPLKRLEEVRRVFVVTENPSLYDKEDLELVQLVHIPFRSLNRSAYIQYTLMFLLTQGLLEQNDVVVNLFGMPGSGYFDTIRLVSIEDEVRLPELYYLQKGPEYNQHILTQILQIAGDLAVEGREGKAVGTLFVFGDYEKLSKYTRQMIINPFTGIKKENRNILDPSLEETIKEYAKIDGAFIINTDGTIMSAGTYISGTPSDDQLHPGLGARHAAGIAITTATESFAVVISESTRKISLFHRGKRILYL